MYSQIKSSYKKSREEFLEQIKSMRKQLEQKQTYQETSHTYIDRIIRTRKNYSMQGNFNDNANVHSNFKAKINRVNLKSQLTAIEDHPDKQAKSYSLINPQAKQRIYNNRDHKSSRMLIKPNYIHRQNSLPQHTPNSRQTTASSSEHPSFQPHFLKIPKSRERRTNTHLTPVYHHLHEHNKLFQKLDQYLCLCLLKIGYFHEVQAGNTLYCAKFDKSSFYVVLSGLICLMNGNTGLRKMVGAGDTLGEEMMFGVGVSKYMLETAKAVVNTYVLQIRTNDYISMAEQLNRLGFSKYLQQFEDVVRDGFTEKNIARGQHILDRKKSRMRTQF